MQERGIFKQVYTMEANFNDKKGQSGRSFSHIGVQCKTLQLLNCYYSSAQDQMKPTFALSVNKVY